MKRPVEAPVTVARMPATVDPAMEAWIAEQMTYFKPSDMDAAVRLMRGYEREDHEKAAQHRTQQGSAA